MLTNQLYINNDASQFDGNLHYYKFSNGQNVSGAYKIQPHVAHLQERV